MTAAPDYLPTPLAELLSSIGLGTYNNFRYFDTGSLFWSLTRLFGYYDRVIAVHDPLGIGPNTGNTSFLDADIEAFIIRYRIVLNTLSFVIRQLYADQIKGLPQLRRTPYDKNKEVSFRDLHNFLKNNPTHHPALLNALEKNKDWLYVLLHQREDLLHYKGMVVIFEPRQNSRSFAILKPGGDHEFETNSQGQERIKKVEVFAFVNTQMRNLHHLIDVEIVQAIQNYVVDNNLAVNPVGIPGTSRMQCPGIQLFRAVNGLL